MDYFFKVIASEDWKGLREDFKMFSEVIGYKLDYTPKFIRGAPNSICGLNETGVLLLINSLEETAHTIINLCYYPMSMTKIVI